jgi:hypothetical protein
MFILLLNQFDNFFFRHSTISFNSESFLRCIYKLYSICVVLNRISVIIWFKCFIIFFCLWFIVIYITNWLFRRIKSKINLLYFIIIILRDLCLGVINLCSWCFIQWKKSFIIILAHLSIILFISIFKLW